MDPLSLLTQNPNCRNKTGIYNRRSKKLCCLCDLSVFRVLQHLRTKHSLEGEVLSRTGELVNLNSTIIQINADVKTMCDLKVTIDSRSRPTPENHHVLPSLPNLHQQNDMSQVVTSAAIRVIAPTNRSFSFQRSCKENPFVWPKKKFSNLHLEWFSIQTQVIILLQLIL